MADGQVTPADIQSALAGFKDPETGRGALQMEQIRDIQVSGDVVSLTLALSSHSAPLRDETEQALRDFCQLRLKLEGQLMCFGRRDHGVRQAVPRGLKRLNCVLLLEHASRLALCQVRILLGLLGFCQ